METEMTARLKERLKSLKEEDVRIQARLAEIEKEASKLGETKRRIAGAIQVLEEELARPHSEGE